MGKKTKKVCINLTEEQYQLLEWLAAYTRRSISEISALILIDNAKQLFIEMQPQSEWEELTYCYVPKHAK